MWILPPLGLIVLPCFVNLQPFILATLLRVGFELSLITFQTFSTISTSTNLGPTNLPPTLVSRSPSSQWPQWPPRKCGAEAVAQTDCVVYRLRRSTMDTLEREDPAAAVLLQKVLLRDLSQLMAQFLCPLQVGAVGCWMLGVGMGMGMGVSWWIFWSGISGYGWITGWSVIEPDGSGCGWSSWVKGYKGWVLLTVLILLCSASTGSRMDMRTG